MRSANQLRKRSRTVKAGSGRQVSAVQSSRAAITTRLCGLALWSVKRSQGGKTIKPAIIAGIALAIAVATGTGASAQERIKWKMQSAWPGNLIHTGASGVRFAKNIERVSGGNLEIKFYEPGALVPALECFNAASKGSVEACWTTPGFHTGKIPALAFFSAVPFGPPYGEFFAWKKFHGGDQLKNELYAEHGLYSIDTFAIGPETSGWFRNEITSLDQLRGLKMRFFGLGAQVMEKLGSRPSCWRPPTFIRRWNAA